MLLAFIVLNDPELSWTQHDCQELHECEGTSYGATETGNTWTQGNNTCTDSNGVTVPLSSRFDPSSPFLHARTQLSLGLNLKIFFLLFLDFFFCHF